MKKTAAIICEFNPFHLGHKRLIDFARERGAENIVCIMSGNFVQRGEPAVTDKYTRAKSAVLSGADLVLELPMPFSAGSAEYFARAGVFIADRLGIVDELVFGSETGDIETLCTEAEKTSSEAFLQVLEDKHVKEKGYAVAASMAYRELFGDSAVASSPNNILALEYIKALRRIGSDILPVTVLREDNYLSAELAGEYPSATALRKMTYDGELDGLCSGMTKVAYETLIGAKKCGLFPTDLDRYGEAVMSVLRLGSPCGCEGGVGGLENRIREKALACASYSEMLAELSTKKYSDARIRRTVLSSVLGIKPEDMKNDVSFVNLLATSEKGKALLGRAKKKGTLAVITKPSELKRYLASDECANKDAARRQAEISAMADALFTLCLPAPRNAGFFERTPPFLADN